MVQGTTEHLGTRINLAPGGSRERVAPSTSLELPPIRKDTLKNRCLLLACLLSTVAFAGCGGWWRISSDEALVEATIETAMLEKDSGKCTELYTAAFREQTTNKTGSAAVEECEKPDAPNDRAKSIEISNLGIDEAAATADVAISGGSFSGQTITVALVEDGDRWKLDALTRFAKLDVDELAAILERQAEGEGAPDTTDPTGASSRSSRAPPRRRSKT